MLSKTMEKKEGQKFANKQNSIVVGDKAPAVERGQHQVLFVLQVWLLCIAYMLFCYVPELILVCLLQTKSRQERPARAPAVLQTLTAAEVMPKPKKVKDRTQQAATVGAAAASAPSSPNLQVGAVSGGSVLSIGVLMQLSHAYAQALMSSLQL